jgi:hypothetical protein
MGMKLADTTIEMVESSIKQVEGRYIQTTTRTKTELLENLLNHDFFFANEVFGNDDILTYYCGSWLLVVIFKFNPKTINDFNKSLDEYEARYTWYHGMA